MQYWLCARMLIYSTLPFRCMTHLVYSTSAVCVAAVLWLGNLNGTGVLAASASTEYHTRTTRTSTLRMKLLCACVLLILARKPWYRRMHRISYPGNVVLGCEDSRLQFQF